MIALLVALVLVSSVACLVSAIVGAFAARDARMAALRYQCAAEQHARQVPEAPRKRTVTRASPRAEPIAYSDHHPTPDPAHPHASPFRGDTWVQGTPRE